MLCIILLAFTLHLSSSFMEKVVIVWGKPESYDVCTSRNDLKWMDCIKFCKESVAIPLCALAATDYKDMCYLCPYEGVTSVTPGIADERNKVAFRIMVNLFNFSTLKFCIQVDTTSLDYCPSGVNPPTFDNVKASADITPYNATDSDSPQYIYFYTVLYSNSIWSIIYSSVPRCLPNFVFVQRESHGWCITLIQTSPPLNYAAAVQGAVDHCGEGILSGVTSQWEMDIVVYQGGKIYANLQNMAFYIRMDGKRTAECEATPTTEECMSIQGFDTMDKDVTSFQFYNWIADSSAGATTGKQCIVTVFDGVNNGKQDFGECGDTTSLPVYAFVCGLEAAL
ncbi:hypothetical protein CRE_16939 [Caenorhabditis remanei]|uniref:PAN-3 domain-containing protein n=1 Tax=Caenorhabditis remanei TaxID=31234 RepID=E3N2C5_CAERE|nr:hypothetical protein CRE_16939 [Caenorhabditis remanei]